MSLDCGSVTHLLPVTYQNHDISNAIVLSSTKYHMHDYYAKCTTTLLIKNCHVSLAVYVH